MKQNISIIYCAAEFQLLFQLRYGYFSLACILVQVRQSFAV